MRCCPRLHSPSQCILGDVEAYGLFHHYRIALPLTFKVADLIVDALAKIHGMAKYKFRPTRLGVFQGRKHTYGMSRS